MKKILAAMSMLFIFVSLTACNENLDAFELLELTQEAQADIDSMIMDFDTEINISMPGMSINMPLTMRFEIESEERMQMDFDISLMGANMNVSGFLRDGYAYTEIDMDGRPERTREETSINDTMEMTEMMEMFDTDSLEEEMFEEALATSTDDGYRIEFVLNTDGMMTLFENLGAMGAFMDGMLDGSPDFRTDDDDEEEPRNIMILYLDEDYLPISTELNMVFGMTVEGMDAEFEMNMTMIAVQFGDVSVNFPAWLDEFEDAPTIQDSELLGLWENGSGERALFVFGSADTVEFLADGTVIIDGRRSQSVDWQPIEPGIFTSDGHEFTYAIRGDVLTIIDSLDDRWSFEFEGTASSIPIEDSDLLGLWENGTGRVFLWVFGRADSVEFLADGTLIITEDDDSETVDWSPDNSGVFTADGRSFTYSIDGDVLTITDSSNDEWSFDREGSTANDEDEDDEDWRQFLADYDDLVTRVLDNPIDASLLEEAWEMEARADDIIETIDNDDILEFMTELLRILERLDESDY